MDHAAGVDQPFRFLLGCVTLSFGLLAGSFAWQSTLVAAGPPCATVVTSVGSWQRCDTANFAICCPASMDAAAIAGKCETLRAELARKWFGEQLGIKAWQPRCYVVFHPSEQSYLREVGEGGRSTLGSSLVATTKGHQISSRRIDLRGDVADPLSAALPHELTHLILAEAFADCRLPRWADEGMALEADQPEKLALHARDLELALARHEEIHVGELLGEMGYPASERRGVFYGESASLVCFFLFRRPASEFVRFIRRAADAGNDAALREVYGIEDVGQLEHLWKSHPTVASR